MKSRNLLATLCLLLSVASCVRPPEKEAIPPQPTAKPADKPDAIPSHPSIEIPEPMANHGFVEWQLWRDWPGESLRTALKSPRWEQPSTRRLPLRSLESARDVLDDFAVRISGELLPPQTGDLRFILEVQGEALLHVNGEEIVFAANEKVTSEILHLTQQQKVPFELFHKSGQGPDSLRLGWILPDGELEMPIGPSALAAHTSWEELHAANVRQVLINSRLRTYDAERHMARHPHNPRPGEHIVRETFYTAGALLESDDPEEHAEAFRAIRAVIDLQNTYEPAGSFGNWPRVVQQPGNFNAQNIGGFIGAEIIIILHRHNDKLPEDLRDTLREALRRAAHRSRRYNPPVSATNIVTKAVAVALIADAMLDIPEARAWGENRLRELHAHTLDAGMPTEYNSPTYNRVSLEALSMLRALYSHEELSPLIEDLYRISWRELMVNYHPNLQLWVGNASRSYDGITHPGARLQEATAFTRFFGESSASRLPSPLPDELYTYLDPLTEPETRVIPVLSGGWDPDIIFQQSPVPLVSTVHLDPSYAFASFNRGDLWNQRRTLTLTWGRRDHAGHMYLASPSGAQGLLAAQTSAAQDGNRLLLLVNFATDAGWGQHPWELYGADREAPSRNITNVRVRFHTLGPDALSFEVSEANPEYVLAKAEGMTMVLRLVGGQFGAASPVWERSNQGHLDLVLNTNTPMNLHELEAAFAAVAIEIREENAGGSWLRDVTLNTDNTHVFLRSPTLNIRAGKRPGSYATLQSHLLIQTPSGDTP